jgi:hypothetical protein
MTPSKISVPLFLGIAGTIGFNFAPIVLGYDMLMNLCFMVFAGIMLMLSFADKRVLGYATVLTACNPANGLAYMSYSFLLASLTIVKESPSLGRVIWELGKRRWWWFYLAAFVMVWVSVPSWPSDSRAMLSEMKQVISRLGFVVAFPLAVGLTLRTPRDGIRAVSLLCLMAAGFFFLFFYYGAAGMTMIVQAKGEQALGLTQAVGNIYLNFNRTGVCIPLAVLAVAALALGTGGGFSLRAAPFYLASAICVYMIMSLASVGSAFAMVCGMGVVALGYFGVRLTLWRILLGIVLFSTVGWAMYWAVFNTENALSKRIVEKTKQFDKIGIDRMDRWKEGIAVISETPFGEGWTSETGHSDWLLFLLSYGWAPGFLYMAGAFALLLSMWRALRRHRTSEERVSSTMLLVGLAGLTVYVINSVLDMLSSNLGYYDIVWALILASATVAAVTEVAVRAEKTASFALPSPSLGNLSYGMTKMPLRFGKHGKNT